MINMINFTLPNDYLHYQYFFPNNFDIKKKLI